MATAYSVLANGGVYMEPYIVDSITLGDGTVIKFSETASKGYKRGNVQADYRPARGRRDHRFREKRFRRRVRRGG